MNESIPVAQLIREDPRRNTSTISYAGHNKIGAHIYVSEFNRNLRSATVHTSCFAEFGLDNILPTWRRRKRDTWRGIWNTNDDMPLIITQRTSFISDALCARVVVINETR